MTSKDVRKMLEQENGQNKLYKICETHFNLVDKWEERLVTGDLLNEYELSDCIDKLTGCQMRFSPIAGALEAIMISKEHNEEVKGYSKIEKLKAQDCSVVRANARASVNDLRGIVSDFRNYFIASEKAVTSAQSRMKRLTVEKGARRVDYTGIIPETYTEQKPKATPLPTTGESTCWG